MPTVQTGNASDCQAGLVATVTALANNGSGAIRVTTSLPHGYGPNDVVLLTTPVIEGIFTITIIDSTHFDCQGSSFTATSTGTATDQCITPQISIPTDGDPRLFNVGLIATIRGILSRTQRLALNTGSIRQVASLAALRALPLFNFQNGPVLLTPENNGQNVGYGGGVSATGTVGGIYYYDAAYNVLDNSSTAVRPNANPSGPGMWRLSTGGGLFVVGDYAIDTQQLPSTFHFTTNQSSNGTVQFLNGSSAPFGLTIAAGAAGGNVNQFYVGDTIDAAMNVTIAITGGGTIEAGVGVFFTKGGSQIGQGASILTPPSSGNLSYTVPVRLRYLPTAADVTAGLIVLSASATVGSLSVSGNVQCSISDFELTLRRS